jgi:hypothetical protein
MVSLERTRYRGSALDAYRLLSDHTILMAPNAENRMFPQRRFQPARFWRRCMRTFGSAHAELKFSPPKRPPLAIIYMKGRWLTTNSENLPNIYPIEIKMVSKFQPAN